MVVARPTRLKFKSGFWNPGNFNFWNPESSALESVMQLKNPESH